MSAHEHKDSKTTAELFAMPDKVGAVIQCQRNKLIRAITVLYCLHSALRWELEDAGPIEGIAVEAAIRLAELPEMTAMLLETIHSVHEALDLRKLARAMRGPAP
jgi:hypothetical protein